MKENRSALTRILPISIIFITIIATWLYFHFSEDEIVTNEKSEELTNEIVNETLYPDTSVVAENIPENNLTSETSDKIDVQVDKNEDIIEQTANLSEDEIYKDNMSDGQIYVKCYPWADVQGVKN